MIDALPTLVATVLIGIAFLMVAYVVCRLVLTL